MQLYIDAIEILEHVKDFVIFTHGDSQNLVVNEDFVRNVDITIKNDYYKYNRTYLPCTEVNQQAVLAGWNCRNVKSYMKAPELTVYDSTSDRFMKHLLKHDIDINEYCFIYESSSTPPINRSGKTHAFRQLEKAITKNDCTKEHERNIILYGYDR
ncbi:unnamed protein product [Adineta steineri]|uniref:Uncharacterized protein n=1 Tax=Adineta steineri TaxID=433720 RepID=A0A814ULK9_9BILA|nr:unnamed protein product [Adineta steineri]CAF1177294.1 unnamed protein product [Adineta steineri]